MSKPTIMLAADHRGFLLKSKLIAWLVAHDYKIVDLGTDSDARCDAGDYAGKLAAEMKGGNSESLGVLICGTGQAMAMTANRYQNLRAALCTTPTVARLSRQHNDANILVMGADVIGEAVALDCLEVFLSAEFLGERYAERRDKLTALGGL